MNEEKLKADKFEGDQNPFKIPKGYFKDSRDRIMDVISDDVSDKPVKRIALRSNLYWISGVAASLIIGFVLFQNLYLSPRQDSKMAQEIEWFVNYTESELNSGLLASYMAEEGLDFSDDIYESEDSEQYNLIEVSDIDDLYIIEEMMNSENY